jgi:lysozyme family protein
MNWLSKIFAPAPAAVKPAPLPPVPVQDSLPPPPAGTVLTFEEVFERLIGHEGKFTDDRKDKGNWTSGRIGVGELKGTKYGISAMTYPHLDIKNLTLEEAKQIYLRDFWLRAASDQYDGAIAYQVFDAAVNHGIGNDGVVGPMTLRAVQAMTVTDVLMLFNAERLEFYTKLSTWETYGRGWARRIVGNLRYGAADA